MGAAHFKGSPHLKTCKRSGVDHSLHICLVRTVGFFLLNAGYKGHQGPPWASGAFSLSPVRRADRGDEEGDWEWEVRLGPSRLHTGGEERRGRAGHQARPAGGVGAIYRPLEALQPYCHADCQRWAGVTAAAFSRRRRRLLDRQLLPGSGDSALERPSDFPKLGHPQTATALPMHLSSVLLLRFFLKIRPLLSLLI